jgi:hypothetical protein
VLVASVEEEQVQALRQDLLQQTEQQILAAVEEVLLALVPLDRLKQPAPVDLEL